MRAAIVILGVLAGVAAGQPSDDRIEALVAKLDDESFQVRDGAARQLEAEAALDLKTLERLLKRGDLSAEQRARLEALGWTLFRRGPRGGMGVQFGSETVRGVQIQNTVPDFPANAILKPGDIILEVDGAQAPDQEDLRLAIVARDPGDEIEVLVEREGEQLSLSIPLGSFERLSGSQRLGEPVLRAAWERRGLTSRASDGEPTIDARGRVKPPQPDAAQITLWEPGPSSGVVGGGEPRGGVDQLGRVRLRIAGRDVSLPPIPLAVDALRQRDAVFQLQVLQGELQAQRQAMTTRLRDLQRAADDESLDPEDRRRAAEQATRMRQAMGAAETKIRELWDLWDEVSPTR